MIRATYKLLKPQDAIATLTLTMTVGEWNELRAHLTTHYPAWVVGQFIGNLLDHASKHFDDELKTEAP